MRALVLFIIMTLLVSLHSNGQKELVLSQYMHNQYAFNSAFAGSREGLSVFGAFRKQWVGIPGAPESQLLTAHMPLKKMKVALGVQVFNETIATNSLTGVSFSYTYRFRVNRSIWMGLSMSGGLSSFSAKWSEASLENPEDPLFAANESSMGPQAGFGWSIYNNHFFGGFSVPELFSHDFSYLEQTNFDLSQSNYYLTGGYLFDLGPQVAIQPSFLARYNPDSELPSDFSATLIFDRLIWGGLTYRTNHDVVAMAGWQILPQLRVAYSFDYSMGDIGRFNKGSHEISIQYDLKYMIHSPNIKFF